MNREPRIGEIRLGADTADGVERGLGLAGELAFRLDGLEVTLQMAVQADGK